MSEATGVYTIKLGSSPADHEIIDPDGKRVDNAVTAQLYFNGECNTTTLILHLIEPDPYEGCLIDQIGSMLEIKTHRYVDLVCLEPIIKVKEKK